MECQDSDGADAISESLFWALRVPGQVRGNGGRQRIRGAEADEAEVRYLAADAVGDGQRRAWSGGMVVDRVWGVGAE